MNSNERFVFRLALTGCIFGLAIYFLPEQKAIVYAAIPTALVSGAFAYLGTKKND